MQAVLLGPENASAADKQDVTGPYENVTFNNKIQTVQLRSSTWEFSSPVIALGSDQQLELLFDDLSDTPSTFGYTLVLCDTAWYPSPLTTQEYLSGMGQGIIRDTEHSVNTTMDYMHYHLIFPEEDCKPLVSGNYALVVFRDDNPDQVVLTRRFYVAENLFQLTGKVVRPQGDYQETGQQVQFTVNTGSYPVPDPERDVYVLVRQNGNDHTLRCLKPTFIHGTILDFTGQDEGIFLGGNEYRTLDIKSMQYQTENIARIDRNGLYYQVYLKPDKVRATQPYFSKTDLNGNYRVDVEKAEDKNVEADYVYVHFRLDQSYPFDSDVYVFGQLTDWQAKTSNKMIYNAAKGYYEGTLLLKQGFYDYAYALADKKSKQIREDEIEGNFSETGNQYEIFAYLHDAQKDVDRLAGYLPVKTP